MIEKEVTSPHLPHLTLHFIRGRGAAALRVGLPSSPAVASGQGHLYVSKKADHLPDLTLSFELLQSTDISRSHQPALTGNGCHYQMNIR